MTRNSSELTRMENSCDILTIGNSCELTILMPCLNESETIAACIMKAQAFLMSHGIDGEILIADNGSSDGSQALAEAYGARVVAIDEPGYGSALIGGIHAARGKYIVMGDSDDSYDFTALGPFIDKLRDGFQLVMGNRFLGGIKEGAMPPLHRYLGNPVLSTIGRVFFRSNCGDFHCGLRGFEREAILGLDLQSTGMELASEMIVKATVNKLKISEVPTTLSPDGRSRPSHLRSWRDGWRHLRFLLLFSPRWLFLYPGFTLFVVGLGMMVWLLPEPRIVAGVTFDIHTLLFASIAVVIGFQSVLFWVFAKIYGMREGFLPWDSWFESTRRIANVENGLVASIVLLVIGVALGVYALGSWDAEGFGALKPGETMRLVIPSATAILLAMHLLYGAFFIGLLDLRATRKPDADISNTAPAPFK